MDTQPQNNFIPSTSAGQSPQNLQPQSPKNTWKIAALVIIGILVLAGAAWGGYYW